MTVIRSYNDRSTTPCSARIHWLAAIVLSSFSRMDGYLGGQGSNQRNTMDSNAVVHKAEGLDPNWFLHSGRCRLKLALT